jgi:hypothetical protein
MAMKCVAQMPHPPAVPAPAIQARRVAPSVARARWNSCSAARLAMNDTATASAVSRQSCWVARQLKTRNIAACLLDTQ